MIRIKRDNLHSLETLHFSYFEKYHLKKLKDRTGESEKNEEYREFFKFLYERIERIIKGDPEQLSEIISEVQTSHPRPLRRIAMYNIVKKKTRKLQKRHERACQDLKDLVRKEASSGEMDECEREIEKTRRVLKSLSAWVSETKDFIKKIDKIFDYDHFCNQYEPKHHDEGEIVWGAYKLVKSLQIGVCPYCNRQFITVAEPTKGEEGKTRPQLDHFYSQSKYPFLAVSFYNMIPCCYVCNSNLKRDREFSRDSHLHPYEQGFEDIVQFTIRFPQGNGKLDYVKAWYNNPDIFSISLKLNEVERSKRSRSEIKSLLRRVNNNKRVSKIRTLYNSHRDYVGEILVKSMRYNDAKLEALHKEFPHLFPSKESLIRLIYGNYVDLSHLDRRVLAKLTKDITNEYGIRP